MQISRYLIVACVASVGFSQFSTRAADTEGQIRAREALRSKINELDAQAPTNAPAPAKSKPAKPAKTTPAPQPKPTAEPTPAPAPVTQQPTPAPEPAPAPVVPTPAPVTIEPVRPSQPRPPPVSSQGTASRKSKSLPPVIAAPAASPESIARARELMREKLGVVQGREPQPVAVATPAPTATQPTVSTPEPAP